MGNQLCIAAAQVAARYCDGTEDRNDVDDAFAVNQVVE